MPLVVDWEAYALLAELVWPPQPLMYISSQSETKKAVGLILTPVIGNPIRVTNSAVSKLSLNRTTKVLPLGLASYTSPTRAKSLPTVCPHRCGRLSVSS